MVTGTKRSYLELKKQLESVYPIKASIVVAGSTKDIKALNRRICWGEKGILYRLQTPMDVKHGNPVWLDAEQTSKTPERRSATFRVFLGVLFFFHVFAFLFKFFL